MHLISWHTKLNIKWYNICLGVLLVVDVLFILGHICTVVLWNSEPKSLLLDANGFGYPESFQYIKYLGILGFLSVLLYRQKRYAYLPLFVLFALLLADDVLQLHRKASWFFVHLLNLHTLLGVKALSIGQLVFTATISLLTVAITLKHYLKASASVRKSLLDIFFLLAIFLFFGVGVDLLHTFFEEDTFIAFILTLIEEGGEMLTLSILVWYFCRLTVVPKSL